MFVRVIACCLVASVYLFTCVLNIVYLLSLRLNALGCLFWRTDVLDVVLFTVLTLFAVYWFAVCLVAYEFGLLILCLITGLCADLIGWL